MSTINLFILQKISHNSIRFGWDYTLARRERFVSLLLDIKKKNDPWNRRIVTRNITQVFRRKFFLQSNLPNNQALVARVRLLTTSGRKISQEINFDSYTAPKAPTQVLAQKINSRDIKVTWNTNNSVEIISKLEVAYSSDNGFVWNLIEVNKSATETILSLSDGKRYIFKVVVTSQSRDIVESPLSNLVALPLIPDAISLFDRNFSTVGLAPYDYPELYDNVHGIKDLPSPLKEYALFAMEEWEKVVKISDEYKEIIKQLPLEDPLGIFPPTPPWNGIQLYFHVYSFNDNSFVAFAGPGKTIRINDGVDSGHYITTGGYVYINTNFLGVYSPEMWKEVFVHELGHALGIGVYWKQDFLRFMTKRHPSYWSLENLAAIQKNLQRISHVKVSYPNLFDAYEKYIGEKSYVFPLEHRFNQLGHPASVNNPNFTNVNFFDAREGQVFIDNAEPVPTDIMSYGHLLNPPARQGITPVSIGFLLDCGYSLSNTVIEKNKQITLTFDPINGNIYAGFSLVKFKGNPLNYYTAGGAEWTLLSADVVNNVNTMVWRNQNGRLHYWDMNSNWEWVRGYGFTAPNSPEYYLAETNFQTDLNKDGTIGNPNISYTSLIEQTIESNGVTVFENDPPPLEMGQHVHFNEVPVILASVKTKQNMSVDVENNKGSETLINTNLTRSLETQPYTIEINNKALAQPKWYCKNGFCGLGIEGDEINFPNLVGYNSLAECQNACGEILTPTPTETPTETLS